MKKSVLFIVLLLFILTIGCRESGDVDMNKSFKVKITHLWAAKPVDTWEVNSEKLVYMDDYPKSTGSKVVEERVLKDKEKKKLIQVISKFPFDSIEAEYQDPVVMDGLTFDFEIWYGEKYKKVYIANVYQEDIGKIVFEMNKLFNNDNRFIYKK